MAPQESEKRNSVNRFLIKDSKIYRIVLYKRSYDGKGSSKVIINHTSYNAIMICMAINLSVA